MRASSAAYGLIALSIFLLLINIPEAKGEPWSEDIDGRVTFDRCHDCRQSYFPGDVGTMVLSIRNIHDDRIRITTLRAHFEFDSRFVLHESYQYATLDSFQNATFQIVFQVNATTPELDRNYEYFVDIDYIRWEGRAWSPPERAASGLDFIWISSPITGKAAEILENAENKLQMERRRAHITLEALKLLDDAQAELSLAEQEFRASNWPGSIEHSNEVIAILAKVVRVEGEQAQDRLDQASAIVVRASILKPLSSSAQENLRAAEDALKRSIAAFEERDFISALIDANQAVVFAQEVEKIHRLTLAEAKNSASSAISRAARELDFNKALLISPTDEANAIILKAEGLLREARRDFEAGDYEDASKKAAESLELTSTLRTEDRKSLATTEIAKAKELIAEFESSTIISAPAVVALVDQAKQAVTSAESALAVGNSDEARVNAGKVAGLLLQARNFKEVETITTTRNTNLFLLSGVGVVGLVALVLVSLIRRRGSKEEAEISEEQLEVTEDISEAAEVDEYAEAEDYSGQEVEEYAGERIEDAGPYEVDQGTLEEDVTSQLGEPESPTIDAEIVEQVTKPVKAKPVKAKPVKAKPVKAKPKVAEKRKAPSTRVSKPATQKRATKPRTPPEKRPVARRRSRGARQRRKRG